MNPPRELHIADVYHPEFLGIGDRKLHRFDHPYCDAFQKPVPTLGWDGDTRLCMYLDPQERRFVLMRLEHDNEYRIVAITAQDQQLSVDYIAESIRYLVAHDVRRGFDPKAHVDAINAKVEADHQRQEQEFADEGGQRLAWAARRDDLI